MPVLDLEFVKGLNAFAYAEIKGSKMFPNINGVAVFTLVPSGIKVYTNVYNLPISDNPCAKGFFGYHLHSGEECTGNPVDNFANAKGHYNPGKCPHPAHAGDFPPLLNCRGFAFSAFVTDRLNPMEIIGKTLIIHSNPDDFTTQPSGNSGMKIACGKIMPTV